MAYQREMDEIDRITRQRPYGIAYSRIYGSWCVADQRLGVRGRYHPGYHNRDEAWKAAKELNNRFLARGTIDHE